MIMRKEPSFKDKKIWKWLRNNKNKEKRKKRNLGLIIMIIAIFFQKEFIRKL